LPTAKGEGKRGILFLNSRGRRKKRRGNFSWYRMKKGEILSPERRGNFPF